jgi:hypothetical protein
MWNVETALRGIIRNFFLQEVDLVLKGCQLGRSF